MNRCGVYLLSYKAKQIIQLPVQANNISAEQKDHSCPFVLLSDMKELDTRSGGYAIRLNKKSPAPNSAGRTMNKMCI
jgi:hypothetical protein